MFMTTQRRVTGIILLLSPLTVAADTYPVNNFIDITHYRFTLTLSDATDEISGTAIVHAKFMRNGIRQIRLDRINRSEERDGHGMQVHSVTSTGESLTFDHGDDVLLINLPSAPNVNDIVALDIEYSGIPATGLLIKDNKYGERTFSAITGRTKLATGFRPLITFLTRRPANS